jgi:hypothetical protein
VGRGQGQGQAAVRSTQIAQAQRAVAKKQRQDKGQSQNENMKALQDKASEGGGGMDGGRKEFAGEKRHTDAKKSLGDFSVPIEYKGVNVGRVYDKAWKAAFDAGAFFVVCFCLRISFQASSPLLALAP